MATIYAGADNRILRYLRTVEELAQYPDPPAGAAHTLVFDEDTNVATVADLGVSTDAYRLAGSALTKNGVAVVIAADGESATVRKAAVQTINDLTAYLAITGTPNATQDLAFKRTIARAMRYLIRREFGVA